MSGRQRIIVLHGRRRARWLVPHRGVAPQRVAPHGISAGSDFQPRAVVAKAVQRLMRDAGL